MRLCHWDVPGSALQGITDPFRKEFLQTTCYNTIKIKFAAFDFAFHKEDKDDGKIGQDRMGKNGE